MPLLCISCRGVCAGTLDRRKLSCPGCGSELVLVPGAWLEWEGPHSRGRLLLAEEQISIGRRSSNQVVLEDARASRHHAYIRRREDGWWLEDCDSQNGTRLNGRVVTSAPLGDGDVVQIGEHRLFFRQEGDAGGRAALIPGPPQDELAQLELPQEGFLPEAEISSDEQLRENYRRLLTAYLFLSGLGRESDERRLLERILRFSLEQLPAQRAVMLLREEEGAPLVPAASLTRDGRPSSPGIPDTILRAAVSGRRAVLSADALLDDRFRGAASVVEAGVRSAMCVPLIGRSEVLGALYLDTSRQEGAFDMKDLELLSTIAGQAAMLLEQNRLQRRLKEEAGRREQLSRFLARELVSEVMRQGINLDGEARVAEVAVLFCDIRGFSALSEHLSPSQLVSLLNRFFHRMADVIFQQQGMLDKFIGDAVMAVWGAPIRRPGDTRRALQAGLQMLQVVEELNRENRSRDQPQIQVGIGLHFGPAVIGAIGSALRMEYTVMGDTVNLAARICQLAEPGQFLLSAQAVAAAAEGGPAPRVERRPAVRVKGRSQPVHLYRAYAV